tara:strand:- start:1094 stop:1489 length:396 start_codon:yes stop_codon:yes gene_type:complete
LIFAGIFLGAHTVASSSCRWPGRVAQRPRAATALIVHRPARFPLARAPAMPGPWVQLLNRSALTFGSLFAGASAVHSIFQPDLSVPQLAPIEPESAEGFVASQTFGGGRQGMVYKTGPAGLGYYPDKARRS